MAPFSSSSSPSSSKSSTISPPPPPPPHHSPFFTPIRESDREEYDDDEEGDRRVGCQKSTPSPASSNSKHYQTTTSSGNSSARKRTESETANGEGGRCVSCNNCRPSTREKISVVPLDNTVNNRNSTSSSSTTLTSPNGIFKTIFSNLVKKSPRSSSTESSSSSTANAREEQWKIAVAELSHKLIQATRKRDEALLEASRLKSSMTELEKKLNKLEIYCQNLKSGLEVCANNSSPHQLRKDHHIQVQQPKSFKCSKSDHKVVGNFLLAVSEARSSIKLLARSLTLQLRQMTTHNKVYERINTLLQPYDIKISTSKNPRTFLSYLEALLNKSFFEDFETIGFQKNSSDQNLNPLYRCEANYSSFNSLRGLTWEEVLNKGTKHFSEDFSRFCDRKMSEIVSMLGWNRAWPEPLLQAFFCASKSVWLVHLLATSVHPSLPIFRVEKNGRFDSVYMEDMGGDKARKLVPTLVRIMVAPGFYVYDNVVKCKVLCSYHSTVGFAPSPT
ncbi:hypothetical protein RJ641_035405 [Dillenia turbinata]|uniref:GIL1/IRKI C-terminal domain-containing protein n=1 Tax=Dillenia turbinata TaxID=194707 RepID=A0AAN8ZI85_9MAGN